MMAPYTGTSCLALKGKVKALVATIGLTRPSNELIHPPKEPATASVFKGLSRGFQKFKHSAMSVLSSLANTAGGLTYCARPAIEELELDLNVGETVSLYATASLVYVSRASVMAGNSKKALLHRIISAPGEQEQCRISTVASKQVVTADEALAVEALCVAEGNEQLSQLQAEHAGHDAAASQAASGAGAGSAICSLDLPSFRADLGTCGCHDMGLVQQQVFCSKASQSSNTDRVQIDVGCVVDDSHC